MPTVNLTHKAITTFLSKSVEFVLGRSAFSHYFRFISSLNIVRLRTIGHLFALKQGEGTISTKFPSTKRGSFSTKFSTIQDQISYDVAPNLSSKKARSGTKFNMIQHQNNIIQHQFSGDIFVIQHQINMIQHQIKVIQHQNYSVLRIKQHNSLLMLGQVFFWCQIVSVWC